MPMLRVLSFAMLMVFSASVCSDNIERSMTETEFEAAGLNKLSAEELANLNAWLNKKTMAADEVSKASGLRAATPSDSGPALAPGYGRKEAAPAETVPKEVRSRISGAFDGWYRGKVLSLDNSQQWLVIDDVVYSAASQDSPAVTIKANFLGSWFLKVEGRNQSARVKRIK